MNFTYGYTAPKFFAGDTLAGKALNSWAIHGMAVIQSGQPYSIIDYSGAVGSIFYSTFNGITNPIVPLNYAAGCTRKRRADASLVKELSIHDRYTLRYSFDVYNLTNTTSFDIPQNNVNQNYAFNNVPVAVGSTSAALPTGCGTTNPQPGGLYNCPAGLGITKHAIGSPRQIQMSLRLDF